MTIAYSSGGSARPRTFGEKVAKLNWTIITLLCAIATIGVIMHFSVADGSWAGRPLEHATRFGVVLAVVVMLALVDPRVWLAAAYPFYGLSLLLLVLVELAGTEQMGAVRWLQVGPVTLQPSEFMKIAIIMAIARYYHGLEPHLASTFLWSLPPIILFAVPAALLAKQPDLGAAILISATAVTVMFMAGLRWRYIVPAGVLLAAAGVFSYFFVIEEFQRNRIDVFLNPNSDPLGTGYHVGQSKIAIGSAGLFGKGYLQGSQSQGDFLPEKHTDFIFTMIVEEFGLLGGFMVLGLYIALLAMTMAVAMRARTQFGRLLAAGVAANLAIYVLINTMMVMGLVPVVGEPLPLISHGGTAMLTVGACYAMVLSVDLHRDASATRGLLW
jgi:rod shape determining protein RodA